MRGVRSEKSNKKSINNISSEDSFKNGQYVPQSKPSAKQDYEPIIKKTNKDLFDKRIKGKNSENSDLRKAI